MGRKIWVPTVSGPLAPYAAGFASWLKSRAYSAAADRGYQFDQLSRWLEREGLAVGELTEEQAERFAAARRAAGVVMWASPRSALLTRGYLCELGVAPTSAPVFARGPLEELLADYRRYLWVERRLSDHTVLDAYEPAARLFLAGREGPDGLGLGQLSAAEVTSFPARECPKRSVSGTRDLACALRSFLRYLHVAGVVEAPLVWAVPSVADLRDRTLPRGLDQAAVRRLLASCDRRRLVGRRDFAILLLLVRLGPRAGEVAAIQLEDVDWRHGELLVRGKGSRQDVLPLPVDVGGDRGLSSPSPTPRVSGAVPAGERAASGTEPLHGRDRDAQGGRVAAGDRPGAPPPRADDNRDLRQGRPQRAASARPSVALVAGRRGMTMLRDALADYLLIRRQLGFEMPQDGRLLEGFVEFLEPAGSEGVTTELALKWARLPVQAHPHRWRQRLCVARGFARHLATVDSASEVPSTDLLPAARPRIAHYIYTDGEVAALIAAAGELRPRLRAARHQTLIGLLAVTGMRPGEALALDRHDVDLRHGVVHVRAGQAAKATRGPTAPEHDRRTSRLRPSP